MRTEWLFNLPLGLRLVTTQRREATQVTPRPSQPPRRAPSPAKSGSSIKARASRLGMHDDDDDSTAPLKALNQRATMQTSRRAGDSSSHSRRNNTTTSRVGAISVAGAAPTFTATRGGGGELVPHE